MAAEMLAMLGTEALGNVANMITDAIGTEVSQLMTDIRMRNRVGKEAYQQGQQEAWAQQTGLRLTNAQQQQLDWQSNEAEMAWQRQMDFEKNKYAISTGSMAEAGLNPAMVYGGGNLVQTSANGQQAQASSPATSNAFASLFDMVLKQQEMAINARLARAEEKQILADAKGKEIDNKVKGETSGATVEFLKLAPQERQQSIAEAIARTNNEEQKFALYDLEKATKVLTNSQLSLALDWYEKNQQIDYNLKVSQIGKNDAEAALTMAKAGLIPQESALLIAQAYYYREVGEHAGDKSFEQWLVGSFGEELSDFIHNLLGGKGEPKNPRNRELKHAIEDAHDAGEDLNLAIQLAREGQ